MDDVWDGYLDHAGGTERVVVAVVDDIPAEVILAYHPEEIVCLVLCPVVVCSQL